MAKEFDIDSIINPSIQYSFNNSLLEEDDKDVETDLHKIQIFEKHYHIAMGKRRIKQEEGIVYFIAYLVYEDKVVSKLGIYEKKVLPSELETVDHKTFDFTQEQLIIFNKYIANKELLEPYKYVEKISKQAMKIVLGKETEFLLEEERQKEIIEEIKNMIKIPTTLTEEEEKQNSKFFYKYLIKTKDTSNDSKIVKYIKLFTQEERDIFQFENKKLVSSKIFPEMQNNLDFTYPHLLVLEYILPVKVILVINGVIQFNIVSDRNLGKMEQFQNLLEKEDDYVNFDPKTAVFITTQGKKFKILTLDGEYMINFEAMNTELIQKIYESFKNDVQEQGVTSETKDTRLQAFTRAMYLSEATEEEKENDDGEPDEVLQSALAVEPEEHDEEEDDNAETKMDPPNNDVPNNDVPNNDVPNNGVPNNGVPNNGVPNNGVPNNGVPNKNGTNVLNGKIPNVSRTNKIKFG